MSNEVKVLECQNKLESLDLEIPESVRTMCGSNSQAEYQELLENRKKWSQHFNCQEQLNFFLLLPLNEVQKSTFVKTLSEHKE
jgi:hypothetical protein